MRKSLEKKVSTMATKTPKDTTKEPKKAAEPKAKKTAEKAAVKVEVKAARKPAAAKADSLAAIKTVTESVPLAAVAEANKQEKANEPRQPKLDGQGRAYGTGRRKDAVARVWLKPGKGKIVVNDKPQAEYFRRQTQLLILNQPFLVVDRINGFDVMVTVAGGGLSGQAGAVRHGISRALVAFNPDLRGALKKAGLLTRDSRVVERKKVGLHKARRSKQWAKR